MTKLENFEWLDSTAEVFNSASHAVLNIENPYLIVNSGGQAFWFDSENGTYHIGSRSLTSNQEVWDLYKSVSTIPTFTVEVHEFDLEPEDYKPGFQSYTQNDFDKMKDEHIAQAIKENDKRQLAVKEFEAKYPKNQMPTPDQKQLIKALRQETGHGLLDCWYALRVSNWNSDTAKAKLQNGIIRLCKI